MTLFLIIGCNNGGGEDPQKVFLTSIANLGKGFLDVFVTFGDMVADAFGIKAETKKSDIGKYFTDIEKTMVSVKEKLQEEVAKNGNYVKLKEVVDQFITGTLDKIAAGAKEAAKGPTGDAIGNATSTGHGATPASKDSVVSLVKGIKTIVEVVLKNNGDAGATKTGDDKKDIGALFIDNTGKADAKEENIAKAAASIGAVTGADILQAIAQSKENPTANSTEGIEKATDAAEIAIAPAVANKKEIKEDSAKKDAVIAAGIALRAMAKDGKFAANNNAKDADAVNGAASGAVGKTLSTLIIAIRNTVDSGLKKINEALDTVKQEDKSVEVTKTAEVTS
ncbi:variable large family protein [Borrelia miyamotoi]|uniref:Variable large protein n=2 Tax=Borrelia miyamotoi TaxID=47466 RepID=A0AAQ2WZ29_9SPIR|nr:variable large family protein [Borrelia miyamotoi]QTL84050.1 variable large family protein [Borrelia miyamotoi]WAZ85694.1 variable large family protein [Borrelia miyamotoi]WAZ91475.1 variable large family protein [Borrelia miyamotoi]WAZ92764.1 variable large family protein [Borrelia miyamotoi]WAZ94055.1 variable large family protein [Borrelia miyamotoi]